MVGPTKKPFDEMTRAELVAEVWRLKRALGSDAEDAEQAVQAAREEAQAKDRFLAMLSHELRTPLTPVLSVVTALEASGTLPDELRPAFAMIRRNVELEVRLIDDLLDLTRITKSKLYLELEVVDVHALLDEVVELCKAEITAASLTLTLEAVATDHHVRADPTRLRQVLWNLLKNAVRYTPAGRSIHVRTSNDASGHLHVAVADTGAGIDASMLETLFLPFQQASAAGTQRGGLGLGLANCKGIVEAHGGTIRATSEGPGRGATFDVELATEAAPEGCPKQRSSSAPPPRARTRILLVEDHEDTAEALSFLLGAHGYEVDVASSVTEALARPIESYDIIVSDLGLPDGSGLDLLRDIRARSCVPAVALSGYGTDEDVREALLAGFTGHLTKPIDFARLVETIGSMTRERG